MRRPFIPAALLAFSIGLRAAAAVATEEELPPLVGNPEEPYAPERQPVVGDILHAPTGIYVEKEQMLEAVTDHRIVYVGETHDNPASHRLQLEILKAMDLRHAGAVALGMEMFTPRHQAALDLWVAGELDELGFLRMVDWYNAWGSDFSYYRELLVYCRERGIPVVGLNADKELVHALSRAAPEDLDDALRKRLPDMSQSDRYQELMIEAILGDHGSTGSHGDGFKRVQTLWDQTMAENAARFLDSGRGKERRLVVVAGGQHVNHGYGIPRRLFRLLPVSYCIVGAEEIVVPEEKQDQLMDVDLPRFPMPAFEYLLYCEYELLETGVKLGVYFDESDAGVVVKSLAEEGNAARAGIRAGDRLLRMDGKDLKDVFDLRYRLSLMRRGHRASLVLERGGKTKRVKVEFQ